MPHELLLPPSPLSAANVSTRMLPIGMVTTGTSAVELSAAESKFSSKVEATRQLFSALLKSRGESRNRLYEVLLGFTEPETLLYVALSEYDQHGNEERLALAASLLADMGSIALPALRDLVHSRHPSCGMFIPVIAHLRGVNINDRLALLIILASNPDVYVRYSLLDEALALPIHDARPVFDILSNDADQDIAEQARSHLNTFEAQ